MDFPDPVISVAVEPRTKVDQEKMGVALQKLAQEDPSFRVAIDRETGQTVISGMGELHLDIIVDRMKREFKVDANVGKTQVAYRETIRGQVEIEGKFDRETGDKRQYGHVWLRLEPYADDEGGVFSFADETEPGSLPAEFVAATEKGIQEQMTNGVLAGYPMIGVRATLYKASFHEVDSSEVAFKIAASTALREGVQQAQPALLEPMMAVEVVCPEEHMGEVVGDLNRRRGMIEGMDESPAGKIIRALVPLAEMFGYSTNLRSASQGRATFTMEFEKYNVVPDAIAAPIITR